MIPHVGKLLWDGELILECKLKREDEMTFEDFKTMCGVESYKTSDMPPHAHIGLRITHYPTGLEINRKSSPKKGGLTEIRLRDQLFEELYDMVEKEKKRKENLATLTKPESYPNKEIEAIWSECSHQFVREGGVIVGIDVRHTPTLVRWQVGMEEIEGTAPDELLDAAATGIAEFLLKKYTLTLRPCIHCFGSGTQRQWREKKRMPKKLDEGGEMPRKVETTEKESVWHLENTEPFRPCPVIAPKSSCTEKVKGNGKDRIIIKQDLEMGVSIKSEHAEED